MKLEVLMITIILPTGREDDMTEGKSSAVNRRTPSRRGAERPNHPSRRPLSSRTPSYRSVEWVP